MQATPRGMDLGVRRAGSARVVAVIVVLLATLAAGVVIGRGTAPTVSRSIERVPPSLTLTGMKSRDAQVRRQVMKEMNARARGSAGSS